MKQIAYLHNHSVYSEQDASATPEDYRKRIEEMKSNGVDIRGFALTEHGNMFSIVKGYTSISQTTNFIPACEMYHCEDRSIEDDKSRYHLVLLAKNEEGLRNLYQIVSDGGMHKLKGRLKDFPRVDDEILKKHGKGIIALSACIGGIIPKLILNGEYERAKEKAMFYNSIFDEFYLEVQPNEMEEQLLVNNSLVTLSKETGIELVVTTDSHYIYENQRSSHDILKEMARQKPYSISAHMMDYDDIEKYLIKHNIPLSAITNTVKIADQCKVNPKPKSEKGLLPEFPCPKGHTPETYLKQVTFDNFFKQIKKKKFKDIPYRISRINYELSIICSKGFSSYFLILWDWFKWCKENKIPMGKGRGSAAASIVSYILEITTIDPIANGFVFERFLNDERTEYPDVDSDISKRDRGKAIAYLLCKYGAEYVCQIVTFTQYNLKNTIKAVFSAYVEDSFEEANRVTKAIPSFIDGQTTTYNLLEKYYKEIDRYEADLGKKNAQDIIKAYELLQETFKKYPKIYDAVINLKGCIASYGLHAGGVIISGKPLSENVPLMTGSDTAILPVVQIEMGDLDFYKLLKIDALGLNTLTQIGDAIDLIGLPFEWYDTEEFDDPAVYEMLRNGETTDIFQMSGYNATKMIREMEVNDFEALGVVNAGNRPGPLAKNKDTGKSMVDNYIERKVTKVIPKLDSRIDHILAPTLGNIWYQEQCIELGQAIAGYSLGMADLRIRKILGKKLIKKIPEIRNEFIYGKKSVFNDEGEVIERSEENSPYCAGAINRGFSEELAISVFDAMAEFAKYSFNKAHKLITLKLWAECRNAF